MPNHFHLLLNCPDGGLSEMMQWLQSVVTRRFNARTDSDGPILRGRFRSKEVDSDAYLLTATRYIHTNPIPLLDGRPLESYRWSSLRTYLGHRRPAPWMRTDVVAGMLGDDPDALAALTSGPTGLVAPTVLESVAAFALDEAGDAITGASRLERTVLLVLAGELGDAAGPLVEHLGFDDTRRLRQAVWRADRRADAEPVLRQVAQRLLAAA